MNRIELLEKLVKFTETIPVLTEKLSKLEWDYEGEPFIVSPMDIKSVVQKYVSEDYTADEIESWANLIECREDLELDETTDSVIYQLANPTLEGEITLVHCNNLIKKLDNI
jgi:hypothetical protein